MYRNIGKKIKTLAVVITIILMVASVVGGIITISIGADTMRYSDQAGTSLILVGFLSIIVGCLSAWISSFMLFGYGQLIDNTDKMVKLLENGAAPVAKIPAFEAPVAPIAPVAPVFEAPAAPAAEAGSCFCINCGNKVASNIVFCPKCGNKM